MDSANPRDLWDKVDATWQLSRRAVRSLTSSRAPGFPPRGASAVKQLVSLFPKFPAAIPSLWGLGGHAIDYRPSSKFQMFTILEHAVTTEDYNIIGPLGEVKPSPEDNSPIGTESSVTSSVEFLTESFSSDVDSFEEEEQQLPPATPELPVAFNVETGTALATQASPKSVRPLERSGLHNLVAIDHAEQWKASQPTLIHEQPAEFVFLDLSTPSPEASSLTASDDSAVSSSESLADRLSSDNDSVQGNPPLGAFELPGEFNPDLGSVASLSPELPPETPATPVAAPPSTPTVSTAAMARASQLPLFPESAPDIAGLTQNLAATESSTPLGTSSPATVNSDLSEKCLKLEQLIIHCNN